MADGPGPHATPGWTPPPAGWGAQVPQWGALDWGPEPGAPVPRPEHPWQRKRRRNRIVLAVVSLALIGLLVYAVLDDQYSLGGTDDPNATARIDTGRWHGPDLPGWSTIPEGIDPAVTRRTLAAIGRVSGPRGTGSGWIARRGVVITNNHVVQYGGVPLRFEINGGPSVPCTVIGRTRDEEIAALSCPTGDRPALPIRTGTVPVGEAVLTIGYPMGQGPAMSVGAVLRTGFRIDDIPALATTAQGAPGSSGSPMVDRRGRVFGMVTWGQGDAGDVSGVRVTDVKPLVDDPDSFTTFHGGDTRRWLLWSGALALLGFWIGAWTRYRSGYGNVWRRAVALAVTGALVGASLAQLTLWLSDPSR